MLDWFTGYVGYDGSELSLNRRYEETPEGETIYEKDVCKSIRGTWNSNLQISRTIPTSEMLSSQYLVNPACLFISGNPVKFLQGHNLYGPSVSDLGSIIQSSVRALSKQMDIPDAYHELLPAVHRSRIDLTLMFDLGNDQVVHDWITTALFCTRTRSLSALPPDEYQKNLTGSTTVYWNYNSDRWKMKAYCKLCEMIKNKPNCDKVTLDKLLQLAHGVLRIELTLKRKELKEKETLTEDIFWNYWKRIEVSDMKDKDENRLNLTLLTSAAQRTYLFWEIGQDILVKLKSGEIKKTAYYRHRKEIKEKIGIDIAIANKDLEELTSVDVDMFGEKSLKKIQRLDVPLCQQPDKVAALFRSMETDLFKS